MISSTSLDLPDHRKAAIDAVLRAGCFPLAMEHGTATSDSDAIGFSLELVEQADLYVGIFAHRYGFVPDNRTANPQGWSVTEHEYRQAVTRGIPQLVYLADEEHKFAPKDFDFDPVKRARLQALKEELATQKVCGLFSSPEKLHSLLLQSLFQELARRGPGVPPAPRVAVVPQPPELYAVPPYTLTATFVGRRAELAELDDWAASADRVMVVEAIGGMGKSALTWEWARHHAEGGLPGLAGRVWWSFYERGTSMKTFLRHALAYVTRQDPEALRGHSAHDCGRQLLAELRRRPYLLVLDGFERVLTAYHRADKAQIRDDRVPADKRECNNPRDGDILRQLVHCGPSKVLLSTRLMPKVLEDKYTHQPIPGVRHLALEGLAPGDALALVRNAGVRGRGRRAPLRRPVRPARPDPAHRVRHGHGLPAQSRRLRRLAGGPRRRWRTENERAGAEAALHPHPGARVPRAGGEEPATAQPDRGPERQRGLRHHCRPQSLPAAPARRSARAGRFCFPRALPGSSRFPRGPN
jgi:hypothetical protein